ncbi:MAG: Allantoinase [Candidatus Acidoferrum typicum]|nr:Allantoinase [Candidatus Acidoferrum typicum]
MAVQAFTSSRVVVPGKIGAFAVLVEGEQIVGVVPRKDIPLSVSVTDFGDLAILPGLVDSHIHINEPGRTEWEGFRTATRAAAAGGYTMLVDMPLNCVPATTSPEALEAKRKAAQGQCQVDWAVWGGLVADNLNQIAPLVSAGVSGFKCFLIHPGIDEFTMVNEEQLRKALPKLKKSGLPLLVHAELPGPIASATEGLMQADWGAYKTYLKSRPDEAELNAIELMVSLCEESGCQIHVVHLSTAKALAMLQDAKRRGLPITVETCPHYLHLCSEEIPNGATLNKCAPPIRNRENREALWQGLREGIIDLVATDHSPCPPAMKQLERGDFRSAWGGIPSVSLALSLMWTEARRRGFSLVDIGRWMAEGPAQLVGMRERKGRLAAGFNADMVVFDPESEWAVTAAELHYRHAISPYLGKRMRGKVLMTFLRGTCVYDKGSFPNQPAGREYTRETFAAHPN